MGIFRWIKRNSTPVLLGVLALGGAYFYWFLQYKYKPEVDMNPFTSGADGWFPGYGD
jgi:hypothetical protein